MSQKSSQTRPRLFYGYWILLVGFLCQVIMNGFAGYAFSLFVVPLDTEFGWSRAAIMASGLIMSLTMGFGSPFVGRVIYIWGAKWVIAAGGLALGIGFVLLGLTQALWQFYAFYAIVGLGSAATGVVPTSIVVANWFKKRRGFAIGILGAGIGVGGFVIPRLLSNYIMPGFGWRSAYVVSGIISAAIIIPLSLCLIKLRPEDMGLLPDNGEVGEDKHHQISDAPEPGIKFDQALKTSAFWLMVIGFSTFGFANGHTFQNQVPNLQDVGFSAVEASFVLQIVGIGSAIGKFSFGWLCDYIRPKYMLIIGSGLEVAATLILMRVTSNSSVFTLLLYGILFGLGLGSWLPALSMTTSATFGLTAYGVIFGIYNMLFMIVGAIGPVAGGYIFDTTGSYHLAFLLCLAFYAIAVPSMLLVRRPKVSDGVV